MMGKPCKKIIIIQGGEMRPMAQKRVGLKEIAELAHMSVGNVSMVLSGRGDEARISKASQQRVFEAAQKLQYKPNVYARRLRMQANNQLTIALYFCPSPHLAIAGSFMDAIHEIVSRHEFGDISPEVVLYPYQQGRLKDSDKQIHQACFDGVIFMGMSKEDCDYIESIQISAPIVLFNRASQRHHYVFIDNASIGEMAARLFKEKQYKNVYLVTGRESSTAGKERCQGFIDACERFELPLPEKHILRVSGRYKGGEEVAEMVPEGDDMPDAIFFSEGLMAFSALYGFHRRQLKVPDQISILTYSGGSSNGYAVPALSSISMPMDEMSRDCFRLVLRSILEPENGQLSIQHKPLLILRDSLR